MGTLLIVIVIAGLIYLLWPAVRIFRQVRRMQRSQEEFWRGFSGRDPEGASAAHEQRKAPRRKKIDATVGEYIEFEEIPGNYTNPAPASFTPEQQISDADFEEIQ